MKKQKVKTINTCYGKRILKVCNYMDNSRLAILLCDLKDGYSDDLTINLPEYGIEAIDEGFINGDLNRINHKGINVVDTFKELGIIKESYGFYPYNYGNYEYVKFDLEKLREYDIQGVKEFEEQSKNIEIDQSISI